MVQYTETTGVEKVRREVNEFFFGRESNDYIFWVLLIIVTK